ncbi:DUF3039 domain-containing protein [Actinomycetaceae bacterium WB03_NA08]|uniref:DUF3039 domain-containing protein n=1 Tax=Scrofimicrobium canadense TaxID=2652290 RepID=A0A6N7WAQ8_9ACTO|nr:DUF3039 domain-containing protein [Scrofimicrobium canadense]MSS85258.1 DUF3039 domain-containing protein [Scrofimicrobium canadense]
MTNLDVIEETKVKPQKSDGDGDRFSHYVRRDRANRSAVSGQPVVALCGKVWVPTRDAKKYPVCPRCKALRDEMGKQGPNWPFGDGKK